MSLFAVVELTLSNGSQRSRMSFTEKIPKDVELAKFCPDQVHTRGVMICQPWNRTSRQLFVVYSTIR